MSFESLIAISVVAVSLLVAFVVWKTDGRVSFTVILRNFLGIGLEPEKEEQDAIVEIRDSTVGGGVKVNQNTPRPEFQLGESDIGDDVDIQQGTDVNAGNPK